MVGIVRLRNKDPHLRASIAAYKVFNLVVLINFPLPHGRGSNLNINNMGKTHLAHLLPF